MVGHRLRSHWLVIEGPDAGIKIAFAEIAPDDRALPGPSTIIQKYLLAATELTNGSTAPTPVPAEPVTPPTSV